MRVNEVSAQYLANAVSVDNNRVLTYDGSFVHPVFGPCIARIHRAIRNDNGVSYEATVRALKEGEPYDIGFWEGDIVRYVSEDGHLLEEIK